jgi:hypothetical protein
VHGLDLCAANGQAPQEVLEPATLRVVVKAAGLMLQERAPGRSVEVVCRDRRGGFQCVEGPRHNPRHARNVVEADAVTFVELAAGRQTWADAVGRRPGPRQRRAGRPVGVPPAAR